MNDRSMLDFLVLATNNTRVLSRLALRIVSIGSVACLHPRIMVALASLLIANFFRSSISLFIASVAIGSITLCCSIFVLTLSRCFSCVLLLLVLHFLVLFPQITVFGF